MRRQIKIEITLIYMELYIHDFNIFELYNYTFVIGKTMRRQIFLLNYGIKNKFVDKTLYTTSNIF